MSFHADRPGAAAALLAAGARHDPFPALAIGDAESVRAFALADPEAIHARLGFVRNAATPLLVAVGARRAHLCRALLELRADPLARTGIA